MSLNSIYALKDYIGFSKIKHPCRKRNEQTCRKILQHRYYTSVNYVNELFGPIIQHLKDFDLYDNTIVVLWGEHGWKLFEYNGWYKQSNFNIDIYVPMIIHCPNQPNAGEQTFEITELIDMFPTLCDLAGIDKPSYL